MYLFDKSHESTTGLMGKSKGQLMRVAVVLHALFKVGTDDSEFESEVSTSSVKAALDLVAVCNEHTKIFAGRTHSSSGPVVAYVEYFFQLFSN